jgi:hypothetical protein
MRIGESTRNHALKGLPMPTKPDPASLDVDDRNLCFKLTVEIMKAQKYGNEAASGPALTMKAIYEQLKAMVADIRAGDT